MIYVLASIACGVFQHQLHNFIAFMQVLCSAVQKLSGVQYHSHTECHLTFTSCTSMLCPGLLLQALPPVTKQLWDHLRPAVLHYCRPPSEEAPFTPHRRQQAAHHMREFARLLQVHAYPDFLFTWNLHWSVCRLPKQEVVRGSTGADAEWWTERVMQLFKDILGDRVSHRVEQVSIL